MRDYQHRLRHVSLHLFTLPVNGVLISTYRIKQAESNFTKEYPMLKYNFRMVIRNLVRLKSHTIISLTGLMLSLACVFVMTAWTMQELQFDKFHKRVESLYMLTTDVIDNNDNINRYPETPPPLAAELREKIPDIENSCHFIYLYGGRLLKTGNVSYMKTGIAADSRLFEIFNFPLIIGSFTALDEPNSIFLSEKFAEKVFSSQDPMGQSIRYGEANELTVSGIFRNVPENSSLQFEYVIPYQIESPDHDLWWQLSDATIIKTRQGSDIDNILTMAKDVFRNRITDEQYNLNLIPITGLRFDAKFDFFNAEHGSRQKLYIFISIAGLILILACLNYVNLISAYSLKRKKEVMIRKSHGAGRKSLRNFFMTESIVLSIIAWFCAILLARICIHFFQTILNVNISNQYLIVSYLAGLFLSIILVGIVSGIYPAIISSSFSPFTYGNIPDNYFPGHGKLKNAFVLFQFILSIALIIACLVIIKQTNYMKDFELGYDKEHIIQIDLPREIVEDFQAIRNDLISNPNVIHISFAGRSPVNLPPIFLTENWYWEGLGEDKYTAICRLFTDQNYLNVFQIPLVSGRFFSPSQTDLDKVVINENLAALTGFNNPVGQIMRRGEEQFEIIGIVKDFHFQHLSNEIHPLLFMYSETRNKMFIKSNHLSRQVVEEVENQFTGLSDQPFSYSFISDQFNDLYSNENKLTRAIIAFTFLTIFLSCIGLIGLVTYNTEVRTREKGIKKVCGARVGDIMILLNTGIIRWLLLGSLLACIISWTAMNKWLESFHHRVSMDVWICILGVCMVTVITFFSISWYTWKASRQNPAVILKYE